MLAPRGRRRAGQRRLRLVRRARRLGAVAAPATCPLPARIAIANLAAAGMPAIMDPAGPVPYRFEHRRAGGAGRGPAPRHRRAALRADGSIARSGSACPGPTRATSSARLAGDADRDTAVEAAYLVETRSGDGDRRLMLGLVGEPGASATVDVPDGTDVVWLEEPLLAQVRAVAEPFHRRGRGR